MKMTVTVGLIHPSYIHVLPKGQAEKPRIISFGLPKYASKKSQSERLLKHTRSDLKCPLQYTAIIK